MKRLPLILLILTIICACNRRNLIDADSRRPTSGVAAADSLILEFDRLRGELNSRSYIETNIVEPFCSIADRHPDNEIIKMRGLYLRAYKMMDSVPERVNEMLSGEMAALDSAASPFDWYLLRTLKLSQEKSIFTKYMEATKNIAFFEKKGDGVELARNLAVKGNALIELSDINGAMECFDRAERIYEENHHTLGSYQIKLNKILLYSPEQRREAINRLLNDSVIRQSPSFYSTILQNGFYFNNSVELLDTAIEIMSTEKIDRTSLPVALSMKACMLVYDDKETEALAMVEAIKQAERDYRPFTRDRHVIHNNLAMIYEANEMPDSCIGELVETINWTDSLQRESNYKEVYANEARLRIDNSLENARLKRRNLLMGWGLSIIIICALGAVIYFRQRRLAEARRYELRLLDEKIRNEQNINFAQSSVLEESEILVNNIKSTLESLSRRNLLPDAAKREINHIISTYKSNSDNREGFLKINREVDSSFARRLKADYPDMAESQLRLAALIAAGIDSRQLSVILNISPKSIYTSRYRLRTRLGLSKEDSLEDFLRRYSAPEE